MTDVNNKTAIIIPIRMASSRFPGKFHADLHGKPMIHHVIDRARESGLTNIFVACDHDNHYKLVRDYGVNAVMTNMDHQSGSDRSYEALQQIDPHGQFEYIVNLQGDMPFFDPGVINSAVTQLYNDPIADISTMVCPLFDEEDIKDPNAVKVVFNKNNHAMYFSRLPVPYPMNGSKTNYFYHVGLYVYRRKALEKYVNLPQSDLEISERLEQLRALENGMVIKVGMAPNIPVSVDTPEDLEYAKKYKL